MIYIKNISIAIDQLFNTILKGSPDETLSSRAYRLYKNNKYWYSKYPYYIINTIFFWQKNHCKGAYNSEKERKHFPQELI